MLLELCPPPGDSAHPTPFRLHLAFTELSHNLPNPAGWTAQLHTLPIPDTNRDFIPPFNLHLLDRAVGLTTLLESVRIDLCRDDVGSAGNLGVRIQCTLVDSRVVEWRVGSDADEESMRLVRAFEYILGDVEALGLEEQKRRLAAQYEEQKRQSQMEGQQGARRRQSSFSSEPASIGKKSTHKRQRSFLHTLVSAMGSIITSQRLSSSNHSRSSSGSPLLPTTYPIDYPFPVTPSPSPPLSAPHSPSPPGTPPPDGISTSFATSMTAQHGHGTHSSMVTTQHPLPTSWTSVSEPQPLTPVVPVSRLPPENSSAYHEQRVKNMRARVSSNLVDLYRRFILGALVFGFSKEVGITGDSTHHRASGCSSGSETLVGSYVSLNAAPSREPATITSPVMSFNPNAHPPRASTWTPNTYSYQLWLLRSLLRNAEEEAREIVEACEMSVKEDFLRAAQAEFDSVDVVDADMVVDARRSPSWGQLREHGHGPSPSTGTSSLHAKVSFESTASNLTGTGCSTAKTSDPALTKKRSRGKLVKKRSFGGLGADGEKEKEGKERSGSRLAIIGSWGRSKASLMMKSSSTSPPAVAPPIPSGEDVENLTDAAVSHSHIEVKPTDFAPLEPVVEVEECSSSVEEHTTEAPVTETSNSPVPPPVEEDCADQDGISTISHTTKRDSLISGCSATTIASASTGITTPSISEACESIAEAEHEEDLGEQEEDIGLAITTDDRVDLHSITSSHRTSPLDEGDSLTDQGQSQGSRSLYGLSLASRSNMNLLDEPTPSMSTTSLFLSTASSNQLAVSNTNPDSNTPELDTNSPDFQCELQTRLNLHPVYSRLVMRISQLRDALTDAEEEKREKREEELRLLDMLEIRSRRRAWSAGVRKLALGALGVIDLSVPFRSSPLAVHRGWTSEDLELEGWEYVPPPNPHPLFVVTWRQPSGSHTVFPSMRDPEAGSEGSPEKRSGKMRKADMKLSMRERAKKQQEDGSDAGFRGRMADDREEVQDLQNGTGIEFSLDASWNSEASLDSDEEEDIQNDLDVLQNTINFGHPIQRHPSNARGPHRSKIAAFEDQEMDDLLHIPPRPRSNPTMNHPPPSRLFAVVEEEETGLEDGEDGDGALTSAGTGTETETDGETEGEGDEFEFDNMSPPRASRSAAVARRRVSGGDAGSETDDDEHFFADIHNITDIVDDIEDGLGRQGRYHKRRQANSLDMDRPRSSRRAGIDLRPNDLDAIEAVGQGYPLESFDVDAEMGLGMGERVRGPSLEWEEGADLPPSEIDGTSGRLRLRPRTPYPKEEEGQDVAVETSSKPKPEAGETKRRRNHRRQWQTMLGTGSKAQSSEDDGTGVEIAFDVEKPKPRFMPAVKKVLLGRSKSQRALPSSTEDEDSSNVSDKPPLGMYGIKPRARTTSLYGRQPDPNSRAGLQSQQQGQGFPESSLSPPIPGSRLPLAIGFGYGSYSNSPAASKPPTTFSESSPLCQPVDIANAPQEPSSPPVCESSHAPTRGLATSPPPVFTPPSETPAPAKHIPAPLDLVAGSSHPREVADNEGIKTPSSASSVCSCASGCSSSNCSSASLPMSPINPQPLDVVIASSNSSVVGSPVIQAVPDELVKSSLAGMDGLNGVWEPSSGSEGEEFTLSMDVLSRSKHTKKGFHLPSSFLVPQEVDSDGSFLSRSEGSSGHLSKRPSLKGGKKGLRKSVLTDLAFYECPRNSEDDAKARCPVQSC